MTDKPAASQLALEDFSPVVIVHAHPDDETLSTGALVIALSARGVAVHVLTATRGEQGEVVSGPLSPLWGTPELAAHRERELALACERLGVTGRAFLGEPPARAPGRPGRRYQDSGMRWLDETETVAGPAPGVGRDALTNAPQVEVADDIVAYARFVGASALVTYDSFGGYGHPDHVFLHHPTRAAAARLGVPFFEIVSAPDDQQSTYTADPDKIANALAAYASQLTVTDGCVVHVGGQRHPIPVKTTVRQVTC